VDFKPKTHFEQVPLEIVKKIAEIEPKAVSTPVGRNRKPGDKTNGPVGKPPTDALQVMSSSFDIFQLDLDGSVLWRGSAADIEEAKQRVRELQSTAPAQYMVVSLRTGSKLFIDCGGPSGQQSATPRPGISQQA
jgi:hypothetical protein